MNTSKESVNSTNPPSPEDLRISEIRYRRLFESARDGILILNATTGKITDVNPFMMELLGYTREEFLGKELWEIGLLKDEAANIAAFEELQKNDFIRYEDLPLESKGGACREVEFVSNVYTEDDRQVIQCNIRDITERKMAEDAWRKTETNYRNLIESSPAIIYLANPSPPFAPIYVSPNVTKFGYTIKEWFDQPDMWLSLIHKTDLTRTLRKIEEAMKHNLETDLEYRIITRDKTVRWMHDKGRFVLDNQGKKIGWQGIILDVTSTKELEAQLRQAQKLESVGLLAGGIAHDFNNMLTAINGYSELTLRKLKADDPLRSNLEEIKNAGNRSAELTHQLLAFSRRQVLQPRVLDINEIILDTTKMLHRVIGENINLTTTLNPKVGRVNVDPGQFTQVVMNLAVNARDAMPEGGKLTIETSNIFLDQDYTQQRVDVLPGAYVLLAVSDTGIGMSYETQRHIFEPFFTMKEVGRGTGLGLATVYGIVKQSGGNIEVYSEENIGTTFKIYLPRVVAQVDKKLIENESYEMLKGTETILLVEDEVMVRNLATAVLEDCGYTVITAANGIEALQICLHGDCTFDLLLTDVVMPQMGGRELAKKLAPKLPHLKILFTSGYTDDAVVRHNIIEADTDFIQKPFSPIALASKIREILDKSSNK